MDKREQIIQDAEQDFGITLDANFDAGVNGLCDGDTCRHDECECWDNFGSAVRDDLRREVEIQGIDAAMLEGK